ncbi:hypothetical protein NA57DRAFT_58616 [Rhizodiscina lignyota]|uniref:Uncharacterized protein n=1 Tax=Rhizodiscina lignyota TaxID=1504668 RepID=A0A9P4IEG1_9PEZI|nr:hypothetical protein NA57DRAFT_58616 [Rhizodiscina lignyota]
MEKRTRKPVAALSPSSSAPSTVTPTATPTAAPSSPNQQYTDELHDDGDLPPSYSGPSLGPSSSSTSVPTTSSPSLPTIPGMPPVDFGLYRIPSVTISSDNMTLTTNLAQYSYSAPSLLNLIQTQSKLPPHPQIRIIGKRDGRTDFDIKISMMRYLARHPESRGGGGWNYVKMLGPKEKGWRGGKQESQMPSVNGGLEEWVNRYVAEESKEKSFTLTKQVINWNTEYLEGQIRNLIAGTNYKGKLTITFPVTHSKLIVQCPSSKPWYQALAACFSPTQTRRFEVITAVWPYAALSSEETSGQGNAWAVKSEMAFWAEWKDVLKFAVLDKKSGWLSIEDYIEFAMSAGSQGKKQTRDWDLDQNGSPRS